jgi:hypothetical protein
MTPTTVALRTVWISDGPDGVPRLVTALLRDHTLSVPLANLAAKNETGVHHRWLINSPS